MRFVPGRAVCSYVISRRPWCLVGLVPYASKIPTDILNPSYSTTNNVHRGVTGAAKDAEFAIVSSKCQVMDIYSK